MSSNAMKHQATGHHETALVSVILVTFNSARFLPACLDSVAQQSYPQYEVIAVDNASSDESVEMLHRHPWVRIIRSGVNLGFARGCNLGFQHARGAILVLLNPDTEVEPEWLGELVRPIREDPTVAITGSKILSADGRRILAAGGHYNVCGLSQHYGAGDSDGREYDPPRAVPYVTGASLAIRRDVWEELGGFHSGYYPVYFEEIELCHRVRQRGYQVMYVPGSRCRHSESHAVGANSSNYVRWYHRNRWRFLLRNTPGWNLVFRVLPRELAWFTTHYVIGLARAGWRQRTLHMRGVCPELVPLLKSYTDTLLGSTAIWASRRDGRNGRSGHGRRSLIQGGSPWGNTS